MEISGKEITITLPKARLLYTKVDSTSLDENSYIVAKDSAKAEREMKKHIVLMETNLTLNIVTLEEE